ncbi:hypothetical protein A6A06_38095 [Streptomyces sp. CB02923]|uniref:hypothetical protein n=1 Tax=Streptomyces sp. CB02923 TaxID=1718985 RepID=UPI00093992F5|nr:hypothetical protein [Streptomyces sp. CB02923]OKI06174.1 hypothetical protein A6A06_38095 [Streptomyces sp. CB02923]
MPTVRARTCIRTGAAVWATAGAAAMLFGVPAVAWLSGSYWMGLVLGEVYFLAQVLLAVQAYRAAGRGTAQALRWLAGSLAWAGVPLWALSVLAWLNADASEAWADLAPRTTTAGGACLLLAVVALVPLLSARRQHRR